MKNKNFELAIIAAAMASVVGVASATEVQYKYTGETDGGVSMGIHTASSSGTVDVGQFVMTSTTPGFTSPLLTYCTDVGATLSGTFNYTPEALSSATGVNPVWTSGGIQNAATLWSADKKTATTAVETAGLQLAIWELLYNKVVSSYSVSTFTSHSNGGFYVSSSGTTITQAEDYAIAILDAFSGLPAETGVEWLAPTESNGQIGGSQGLLYQTANTTSLPPVPDATSTAVLLGMMTAALAFISRKFSAKKA